MTRAAGIKWILFDNTDIVIAVLNSPLWRPPFVTGHITVAIEAEIWIHGPVDAAVDGHQPNAHLHFRLPPGGLIDPVALINKE